MKMTKMAIIKEENGRSKWDRLIIDNGRRRSM
jgi:hypothetical protein